MKTTILLIMCALTPIAMYSTVSKTVFNTAGNLSNLLTSNEKATITDLILKGEMNAVDFKTIRNNLTKLTALDLSEVSIVEYTGTNGTESRMELYYNTITYKENTIPCFAFFSNVYGTDPAIAKCSELTSIKLPPDIVAIDDYAFSFCNKITSLYLPSVKKLGISVFIYCTSLKDITIPYGSTSVFNGCSNLQKIIIPNSILSIQNSAFYGLSQIDTVVIPSSLHTIGNYSFYNCSDLKSIIYSGNIDSIGTYAFYGCRSLRTFPNCNTVLSLGEYAFSNCTSLDFFTFSPIIKKIEPYTFENCSSLTGTLEIPSSTISIGNCAFWGCLGYSSVNMGNSIKSISDAAFFNCSGIATITFSDSLISIGNYAFQNCTSLRDSLVLPNNLQQIGKYAFKGCNKIDKLILPSSVTSIGTMAFADCAAITSIQSRSESPASINLSTSVFSNVDKSACILYVPVGTKSIYQASDQWEDFSNIIEMVMPSEKFEVFIIVGENGSLFENGQIFQSDSTISVEKGNSLSLQIIPAIGYQISSIIFNGVDVTSKIVDDVFTTPIINEDITLKFSFKKKIFKLSIKSAESGYVNLLCEYGSTPSFKFVASPGWRINTITYNGIVDNDALEKLEYTTPSIEGEVILEFSFEIISSVQNTLSSNVSVYSYLSSIVVEGLSVGDDVHVYTVDGAEICKIRSNGSKVVIPVKERNVYIVKTPSNAVKVLI